MPDRRSSIYPATGDIVGRLAAHAAAHPDRIALIHDEGDTIRSRRSYGDLHAAVLRAAGGIVRAGHGGRRIGLLFAPGEGFVIACLAVLATGGVAVPLAPLGRRRERVANLLPVLDDFTPSALLMDATMIALYGDDLAPALAARGIAALADDGLDAGDAFAAVRPDPSALAVLQYTSGSTSQPKGVMISHGNIAANQAMIAAAFRHDERSTFVGWAPHFHDQGLFGNIFQPLWLGSTCVLMSPATFVRRPLSWLEAIARHGAHTSGGPNFAFDLCVEHATRRGLPDIDLAGWKVAFNGAEPIRARSLRAFAAAFAPLGFRQEAFFPCYGLAECTVVAVCGPRDTPPRLRQVDAPAMAEGLVAAPSGVNPTRSEVCCGPAIEGGEVRIVDPETCEPLAAGQTGEVWLAGPHIGAGYWNRPDDSDAVFAAYTAGGVGPYLRTGDLGFAEPEGFYIVGRIKDLIIVHGRNYAPNDIEQLWGEISGRVGQATAAAFQVDRDGRTHVVLLAEIERARRRDDEIDVDGGIAARVQALAARVRAQGLARLDLSITDLVLVDVGRVPRTTSGKVRRAAAREMLLAGTLPVLGSSGPLLA